ncbi:metallophosphoesterase family protein [Paenibacillus sp. BAC0078]
MSAFAILTDIHGNAPALEAVLKDISDRGIRQIFCLGDVVGIGPDSNRVFELLLGQEQISFVSGNHDLAVLAAFRKEEPPPGHHAERRHHEWVAERMNPAYMKIMSNWQKAVDATISGVPMLFTHYHLDSNQWFQPIDNDPSTDSLEQMYSGLDYKLVAYGHHHIVHHFESHSRTFVNPGALGCAHSPASIARYGIVNVNTDKLNVQLLEIPYDNTDFIRSYAELGVPDKDFILKIFHGRDGY